MNFQFLVLAVVAVSYFLACKAWKIHVWKGLEPCPLRCQCSASRVELSGKLVIMWIAANFSALNHSYISSVHNFKDRTLKRSSIRSWNEWISCMKIIYTYIFIMLEPIVDLQNHRLQVSLIAHCWSNAPTWQKSGYESPAGKFISI